MGIPVNARVSVENVHLLERESLGLGDEEVREEEAQHAASTPDEEDVRLESRVSRSRVDKVRRSCNFRQSSSSREKDVPYPIPKLTSQFEAVDMDMALARIVVG